MNAGASHAGLLAGIDRWLALTRDPASLERRDTAVSGWSVAQHAEHLLRSDEGVLSWIARTLEEESPAERDREPIALGVRILEEGVIPRGRGPAPEATLPRGIAASALTSRLEATRGLAVELGERLDEIAAHRATLAHHVLGPFTPAEWLRFLHIHHDHHDAILRDILDTDGS